MAYRDISQQNRDARSGQRMIEGGTANPNATAGAGRGSRNGAPATPSWAGGEQLMPKQSPGTPRLNNLSLTNPNATQESNRSGAFGTGAQNLQQRKDLFANMAGAQGQERTADYFKGQAAKLGVTPGGWANALGKLNMTPPAAAAPAANQANQTALKTGAPMTEASPAAPLPNQSKVGAAPWSIAKPNPYSVPPTTGSMTVDQARKTTQDAINIGKTPAPVPVASSKPAPIPEIPPTLYPAPQPLLRQTQPEQAAPKPQKKKPAKGILSSIMADASSVKNATANVAGNIAYALPWAVQSAMPGQTGEAMRQADVAGKFRKAGSWAARQF